MPSAITHTEARRSTLRISQWNAGRARKLKLPERQKVPETFDEQGYSAFVIDFSGTGSGTAYPKKFELLVALLEGDADVFIIWEGGAEVSGGRIRSGAWTECVVEMVLVDRAVRP